MAEYLVVNAQSDLTIRLLDLSDGDRELLRDNVDRHYPHSGKGLERGFWTIAYRVASRVVSEHFSKADREQFADLAGDDDSLSNPIRLADKDDELRAEQNRQALILDNLIRRLGKRKDSKLLVDIADCIEQGLGRRKIAKRLAISERRVNKLCDIVRREAMLASRELPDTCDWTDFEPVSERITKSDQSRRPIPPAICRYVRDYSPDETISAIPPKSATPQWERDIANVYVGMFAHRQWGERVYATPFIDANEVIGANRLKELQPLADAHLARVRASVAKPVSGQVYHVRWGGKVTA